MDDPDIVIAVSEDSMARGFRFLLPFFLLFIPGVWIYEGCFNDEAERKLAEKAIKLDNAIQAFPRSTSELHFQGDGSGLYTNGEVLTAFRSIWFYWMQIAYETKFSDRIRDGMSELHTEVVNRMGETGRGPPITNQELLYMHSKLQPVRDALQPLLRKTD